MQNLVPISFLNERWLEAGHCWCRLFDFGRVFLLCSASLITICSWNGLVLEGKTFEGFFWRCAYVQVVGCIGWTLMSDSVVIWLIVGFQKILRFSWNIIVICLTTSLVWPIEIICFHDKLIGFFSEHMFLVQILFRAMLRECHFCSLILILFYLWWVYGFFIPIHANFQFTSDLLLFWGLWLIGLMEISDRTFKVT